MKKATLLVAVALTVLGASCGGSNSGNQGSTTTTAQKSEQINIPGLSELDYTSELVIEGNDLMKFDKTLFKVKAGDTLTMVFKNVGELPKESMGHNVVILKPGTDIPTFGAAAVDAKDNEYIPQAHLSSVVAHTKLLGPGEEETIQFVLAEPGVYPYVCSFPGHYGMMQGKIVAE